MPRKRLIGRADLNILVEQLTAGVHLRRAAVAAGVPLRTAQRWIAIGRTSPPDTAIAQWAAQVQAARAECERRLLEQIAGARTTPERRELVRHLASLKPHKYKNFASWQRLMRLRKDATQ